MASSSSARSTQPEGQTQPSQLALASDLWRRSPPPPVALHSSRPPPLLRRPPAPLHYSASDLRRHYQLPNSVMDDTKGFAKSLWFLEKLGLTWSLDQVKEEFAWTVPVKRFQELMDEGKFDELGFYLVALDLYEHPARSYITLLKILKLLDSYWTDESKRVQAEAYSEVGGLIVELSDNCEDPIYVEVASRLKSCDTQQDGLNILCEKLLSVDEMKQSILQTIGYGLKECLRSDNRSIDGDDTNKISFRDDPKSFANSLQYLEKLDLSWSLQSVKQEFTWTVTFEDLQKLINEGNFNQLAVYLIALDLYEHPTSSNVRLLRILQLLDRYWNADDKRVQSESYSKVNDLIVEITNNCEDRLYVEVALRLKGCDTQQEGFNVLSEKLSSVDHMKTFILKVIDDRLIEVSDNGSGGTRQWKRFSVIEVETLISAVEKHGRKWHLIKQEFFNNSPRNHKQLLDKWYLLVKEATQVYVTREVLQSGKSQTELQWYLRILPLEGFNIVN